MIKFKPILALGFLIFAVVSGVVLGSVVKNKIASENGTKTIDQIKRAPKLSDQMRLYQDLISKIGPEKAQELLYRSGLPFTGETHLLNHIVGEYLYEKEGAAGLKKCKEYFLDSCYHGFIIDALTQGGQAEIGKVIKVCRKSGREIFAQCAHAAGHGFLAFKGYVHLIQALKLCDQVGQATEDFPFFNCYDGVFMENIWAVHEDGKPSKDRWVKNNDPFYPCDDPRIDQKYLLGCWSNQPALMYQLFDRDIKKIGEYCNKVFDIKNKEMCFNGLARQIHPVARGDLNKTIELCNLLPVNQVNYCISSVAMAAMSVGDQKLPSQLCRAIDEPDKSKCLENIGK